MNTAAMIIGYFVLFCIGLIVFVIIPIIVIGRHHAEQNKNAYRKEFKKRYGMDPHFDWENGI